jgi:hypothetical protein
MLLALIFIIGLAFPSCNKISPEAPARILLDSTLLIPVSELNVPVFYPVQELEDMANEKLGTKVIEAHLAINQKEDSLHLSISKFQPLRIVYDGNRGLTYSLPVQIDGFLDSRVIGINIRNKEAIRAKVIITMFSELYLDDEWNLSPQTELKSMKWIEEPKINVAGIKFNLKPPIEKAIENNKEKIVEKLDASAKDIIKIRQSIEKLWGDIQKPIRINRKVVPVWLKGDATDMDGKLFAQTNDTLMIQARLNARLHTILDSASAITKPAPLPRLKRNVEREPSLEAFALVTLPFKTLNEVIAQVTDTMKFEYGGRSVSIQSSEIYGTPQGIAIRVSLRGDLKADVYLRGTIGFDSLGKNLVIENFGFDLNSEQSLLGAADWFAHDALIDRLKPYLSVPLGNLFEAIPNLINKGVEKGKLGKKINIHFTEFDLNIYQTLITTDNIQIIVSAKGRADVELQKGLFDKKKKPV